MMIMKTIMPKVTWRMEMLKVAIVVLKTECDDDDVVAGLNL